MIIWKVLVKFEWFNHTESQQQNKKSFAATAGKIRIYTKSAEAFDFIAISSHNSQLHHHIVQVSCQKSIASFSVY